MSSNYLEKRKLLDEYIQSEIDEYPDINTYSRLNPDDIINIPDNSTILFISQCFIDTFHLAQLVSQKYSSFWIILLNNDLKCSINLAEYIIFYKPPSQNSIQIEFNNEDIFIPYKRYFFNKKKLKQLKKQQKSSSNYQPQSTNQQPIVTVNKLQPPPSSPPHKTVNEEEEDKNKSYERYQRHKENRKRNKELHQKYSKHSNKDSNKNDFKCELQYENGFIRKVKVPRKITL